LYGGGVAAMYVCGVNGGGNGVKLACGIAVSLGNNGRGVTLVAKMISGKP